MAGIHLLVSVDVHPRLPFPFPHRCERRGIASQLRNGKIHFIGQTIGQRNLVFFLRKLAFWYRATMAVLRAFFHSNCHPEL